MPTEMVLPHLAAPDQRTLAPLQDLLDRAPV
jgi:hypothetical protein